jgi:hypothetical protein
LLPSEDQAKQFCIMLQAGLPASQAILYFTETSDPGELAGTLKAWMRSRVVRKAQQELMGKSWQQMSLEERIKTALDQHYAGLAYLLFSTNYVEAGSVEKGKLDSARVALEAKMAGTAGKTDALSQFFADINSGKVKLSKPAPAFMGLQ